MPDEAAPEGAASVMPPMVPTGRHAPTVSKVPFGFGGCRMQLGASGPEPERSGPGLEAVAHAPDRPDEGRAGRVLVDLGSQSLDVDVERPRVADVVSAPDVVDERLAPDQAAGLLDEQPQELELFAAKADFG